MTIDLFDTAAILIVLAAGFGLFNHHFLRLPFTIGLLLSALAASLAVLFLDHLFPELGLAPTVRGAVYSIDFHRTLMHGMLSFLLFAGALHVDFEELWGRKGPILALASFGLLLSTAVVGLGSFWLFAALGRPVPLSVCLVFGALISPTDPIAVLGIMKQAGARESLEIKVAGESLLNDGFAVVLFTVLLGVAGASAHEGIGQVAVSGVLRTFAQEVLGGMALGLVAGFGVYRAMRTLDEPNLEVLLSVALVMGVTVLAFRLHASAPLACVVSGIFIGNRGRRLAMTGPTRRALDIVWSFLDESLNAVLFLLIGLEVVAVRFAGGDLLAAALVIPVAILARWIAVLVPVALLRLRRAFSPGAVRILTWGGLKGGISIALALSLPHLPGRDLVLNATYAIVLFSIVVQGLSVGALVRRLAVEER